MDKYTAYLYDLGYEIKLRAFEAKQERDASRKGDSYDFEAGRVLAFNEVISIMQQQAEGIGIPLAELRLDDIDPDRDLM